MLQWWVRRLLCNRDFSRVLCLHAFRTNAKILDAQLELLGWKKRLQQVEFVYVESPYECDDADKRKMEGGSGAPILQFFPEKEYGKYREWWNATAAGEYRRLDATLHRVAAFANANGPFHGVLGFSQGATLACGLVALAERGRMPALAGLLFVAMLSPQPPRDPTLRDPLEAKPLLETPALVCLQEGDSVVPAVGGRRG